MTIEIRNPELEALIQERMRAGGFQNVEDVLVQALQSMSVPTQGVGRPTATLPPRMGAELVAAMQTSPYKEISLEPRRDRLPVRESSF